MSNIAYLRVSHIESLNGTSLETQENKCKAYAELHNFSIDKVYSEVVSGAVEFRKRPVFQKVLSELKSGSKLVVSRLDRLSRKVVDTLNLIDDFKKEHKEICITDIGNIHKDGVSKVFVTTNLKVLFSTLPSACCSETSKTSSGTTMGIIVVHV